MDRIVIIGNGKGALKVKKKDFLESSTIVRINNFKTDGYEEFVGSRTDIYSCSVKYLNFIDTTDEERRIECERVGNFYHVFDKKMDEESFKKYKEAYIKIYTYPKIESSKVKEILCLFTTQPLSYPFKVTVSNVEFEHNYSTGFRTITYCLNRFKDQEIFISGFDNFISSGWYWDNEMKLADQMTRTTHYTDGHPYLLEREKLKELIKSCQVIEI